MSEMWKKKHEVYDKLTEASQDLSDLLYKTENEFERKNILQVLIDIDRAKHTLVY